MTDSDRSVPLENNSHRSDNHMSRLDKTLRALNLTLERLAAPNRPPEVDPRTHFYQIFNKEADEYDRDFHKKYHDDLNTTLIFAGLFSGMASAFIVDVQQELRPDYAEMSLDVLKMLLNTTLGVPNQLNAPVARVPNPSAVQVQSILCMSLASALFAAFLAMLGKQWLNLYAEGSLIGRSRHRELRMRGMITWGFRIIMECVPFVMQLSLLLLAYALAQYMRGLSRTVSDVIIACTSFAVVFYLFIVFAATIWKTCPFQTPISIVLRYVISLARKHQRRRLQEIRNRLSAAVQFRKLNESFVTARSTDEELASSPQTTSGTLTSATAMVDVEEESTQASDTNCVSTMFQFAGASEAIIALTGFIPEVDWSSNVRRVPLSEVYDCLRRSFEFLKDGRVLVRLGMRAQAYGSAKALLHLCVHRLRAGATDDVHIVTSKIGSLLGHHPGEDHELESTLQVLDAVSNKGREIRWQEFIFSDAHYCWLSHILRCRAWVTLQAHPGTLPSKEVLGFVRHSLSREPLPPSGVIADCLLIVGMMVGILPEWDHRMLNKDKSEEIEETLQQIYQDLRLAVSPCSSTSSRQRATEVLELMVHLKQERLYVESYDLFLTIMANVDSDNRLWRLAELSLIGAFQWAPHPRPHVGDPASLIRFLEYCLSEQEGGNVVVLPLERVFLALASAPSEVINEGISRVDFTQALFFNGICRALRKGAPYLLRRATVTFLRHLDAQFFNTNKTFSSDQVDEFISGWSSSAGESLERVHGPLLPGALFGTLLGLLDSPFWRRHIPPERWNILTLPVIGMDGGCAPPSFLRCAKNPDVIPYLEQVGASGPMVLTHWITILWGKYPDLSKNVREQLEKETDRMAGNASNSGLPTYLAIVNNQMEQIQGELESHTCPLGEAAVELRERLRSLQDARRVLRVIEKIPGQSSLLDYRAFR